MKSINDAPEMFLKNRFGKNIISLTCEFVIIGLSNIYFLKGFHELTMLHWFYFYWNKDYTCGKQIDNECGDVMES